VTSDEPTPRISVLVRGTVPCTNQCTNAPDVASSQEGGSSSTIHRPFERSQAPCDSDDSTVVFVTHYELVPFPKRFYGFSPAYRLRYAA